MASSLVAAAKGNYPLALELSSNGLAYFYFCERRFTEEKEALWEEADRLGLAHLLETEPLVWYL